MYPLLETYKGKNKGLFGRQIFFSISTKSRSLFKLKENSNINHAQLSVFK